jgi:hypothetical protein
LCKLPQIGRRKLEKKYIYFIIFLNYFLGKVLIFTMAAGGAKGYVGISNSLFTSTHTFSLLAAAHQ